MGAIARFLLALYRLARSRGIKIEDAYKFAKQEYHRLAVEDDTGEDSDMLENTDAWDSDHEGNDNIVSYKSD